MGIDTKPVHRHRLYTAMETLDILELRCWLCPHRQSTACTSRAGTRTQLRMELTMMVITRLHLRMEVFLIVVGIRLEIEDEV